MSLTLLIIYFIVLAMLGVAAFVVLGSMRNKGAIARALNMSLFLITMPRDASGAQGQRPEKELIAVMEQFLSAFSSIHTKGWNKFIYGEPYIGLEMAVHNKGEEIHFYMAVPRTYEQIFEKQVHSFFPTAYIERVEDYNIFHSGGSSLAAYCTLKENAILPLRTYQNLQTDPLGAMVTALSKIQHEGEGAAFQLLLRPSHRPDKKLAQRVVQAMQKGISFKQALYAKSTPNPTDQTPGVTQLDQEVMKAIGTKSSQLLFDANIRLVVSSESEIRSQQLLNELSSALVQFGAPSLNQFDVVKVKSRALKNLLFQFSFRLFNNDYIAPLSTEEVTSIYHFPLPTTYAPKIKYLKSKPSEPPTNLPNEGIILGKNIFRGQEHPVRMTRSDRRRHLYVLGQTGTGKTTMMKNMMAQDIANGEGMAFIDPHGTGVEEILELIPESRAQDVIIFDPGDVQHPLGLNMLEFDPRFPEQKTFIVNEMLSIFQKLFLAETMGPMFDQYFRNAMLLLMDDYAHEVPTLVNIPRVLVDEEYRRDKLTRETNPIVKNFWQQEAEKAGGEAALANMAPYITSKINGFIANEFLRPILSQPKSAFNFREIMDQKKILLVNLSKGRIGDINASLLGMIIVGKILIAALSRVDVTEDQRPDFYTYIDEFQNFTTDSIATILSEARKYHLNLIIANQFIKQLVDKIRDAVFGNVGSMAVFRVGADDAEYLKNQFEPVFTPQDLLNIDNFNCYVKLLINNQTARPFNIKLDKPAAGNAAMNQYLKDFSRQHYGLQ